MTFFCNQPTGILLLFAFVASACGSAGTSGLLAQTDVAQTEVAQTEKITGADGMQLDAAVELPAGMEDGQVRRVIILVHGSGSHSMDADLTAVTRDKQENLFFRDVAAALVDSGFPVIRYNKRNFQLQQLLKTAPESAEAKKYVATFRKNPLRFFVDDVLSVVGFAGRRFPGARIYLLGHSEGTYVSLQAARQADQVRGVGLIGFAEYSTDTLVFEQTVYRPLHQFSELDKNSDGQLDGTELAAEDPVAASLRQARNVLDFNKDEMISRTEVQAGNFASLLVQDTFGPFRRQEAEYPRVAEILKSAKFKVAFFQGELDNQTPVYHTMAFDLLLNQLGKAGQMQFHYFPGLGHALDHRENYADTTFSTIDPEALKKLVTSLDGFFTDPAETSEKRDPKSPERSR